MFKDIISFGKPHTPVQAIGFYVFYFVVILVISALVAIVLGGGETPQELSQSGAKIGHRVTVTVCVALALLLAHYKQLYSKPLPLILACISPLLAIWGGALLGLSPLAYLTTLGVGGVRMKSAKKPANGKKK